MESATLEISRKFVSHQHDIDDSTGFDAVHALVGVLESKYKPKLAALFNKAQSIQNLRNFLHSSSIDVIGITPGQFDEAREQADRLAACLSELEEKLAAKELECAEWKEKAEAGGSERIPLPSALAAVTQDGIHSISRQLIVCLGELHTERSISADLEKTVKSLDYKWAPMCSKMKQLYRDHVQLKETYAKDIESRQQEVEQLKDKVESGNIKSQRLELIIASMNYDSESLQSKLVESERMLVVLEVNEHALLRRYAASHQVETQYRNETLRLKKDLSDLEKTAKTTISRLNRYRKESLERATIAEEKLAESVSLVEHKVLENKLCMYISKAKILQERERDSIERNQKHQVEVASVASMQEKIQELQIAMSEKELQLQKYKDILESTHSNRDDFAHKQREAGLIVQTEVLEMKREMFEQRAAHAHDVQTDLKLQVAASEKLYMESKEESIRLHQDHLELCNLYEGGATAATYQATLRDAREAKATLEETTRQMHHCKNTLIKTNPYQTLQQFKRQISC